MPPATRLVMLAALGAGAVSAQAGPQFQLRTPTAYSASPMRELAIGDFDGDGDLDLCGAVGMFASGPENRLLRNDGQEQFTDVTATNLPPHTTSTMITVPFDMDGDGDLDLFVSKQQGASRLWRNNGAAVFNDASANLPATAHDHYFAAAADFDGDGDLDLAGARSFNDPNCFPRIFVNNGMGVFGEVFLPTPSDTLGFVALDLEGDGDLDLAAGSVNGPIFLRNDGNLVFTDVTATWQPPGANTRVNSLATGDVDGDGRPDLMVGRHLVSDLVLRNTGNTFVVIGSLPTYASGTKSVVLFDADEDGDLDLARSIVQAGTPIEFARNDGLGNFAPSPSSMPSTSVFSARLYAVDLDGDGDTEMLTADEVAFSGNANRILVNRHRDLQVPPAVLGQSWPLTVWSEPGYATLHHTCRLAIGLTRLSAPLAIPGFGDLWLDLGGSHVVLEGVALASTGSVTFPVNVPPLPQLLGLPLHVQALVEQARHQARFTALRSVAVQ